MDEFQTTKKGVDEQFDVFLGEGSSTFDHFTQIVIDKIEHEIPRCRKEHCNDTCAQSRTIE